MEGGIGECLRDSGTEEEKKDSAVAPTLNIKKHPPSSPPSPPFLPPSLPSSLPTFMYIGTSRRAPPLIPPRSFLPFPSHKAAYTSGSGWRTS